MRARVECLEGRRLFAGGGGSEGADAAHYEAQYVSGDVATADGGGVVTEVSYFAEHWEMAPPGVVPDAQSVFVVSYRPLDGGDREVVFSAVGGTTEAQPIDFDGLTSARFDSVAFALTVLESSLPLPADATLSVTLDMTVTGKDPKNVADTSVSRAGGQLLTARSFDTAAAAAGTAVLDWSGGPFADQTFAFASQTAILGHNHGFTVNPAADPRGLGGSADGTNDRGRPATLVFGSETPIVP